MKRAKAYKERKPPSPKMRVLIATAGLIAFVLIWHLSASAYPLDDISRVRSLTSVTCPKVPLVRYLGTHIRYHRALTVHPAFKKKLARFENAVKDAAIQTYGRAPRRIRHMGSYNCRSIRGWSMMLSEHSLGNALDVSGFDFGRGKIRRGLPRRLRQGFRVDVRRHYRANKSRNAIHGQFLRRLFARISRDDSLFRTALGPGTPRHNDHFHLDFGPGLPSKLLDGLRYLLAGK